MGEAQDVELHIVGQESLKSEENANKQTHGAVGNQISQPITQTGNNGKRSSSISIMWWLRVAMYTAFLLAGQSVATILGRLYYDKGGNSKWMATFVQNGGFPVILLLYLLPSKILNATTNLNDDHEDPPQPTNTSTNQYEMSHEHPRPSLALAASVYFGLGVIVTVTSMLYSLGLLYLPVSTYSLICASQLAFNALFSFFLNHQNFTPYIINSLVLLTVSSALLIFQSDSTESAPVPRGKYAIGFVCTLGASAGYGLILSLMQLAFTKVFRQGTFREIVDMNLYTAMVSTCAVLIGLFASGEWKGLREEMEGFQLGRVSYVMTLVWTALCWQVFSIGCTGLILEVSSLFSNVISTVGMPIVPVLAVFIFHDKMDGIKAISMVLAIWGFVSYVYQHYLDSGKQSKAREAASKEVSLLARDALM